MSALSLSLAFLQCNTTWTVLARMSSEGFLKEVQTIGEKFLLKLQKLPKAEPVEIVSFCVILLFIGKYMKEYQDPLLLHEPLRSPRLAGCSDNFAD